MRMTTGTMRRRPPPSIPTTTSLRRQRRRLERRLQSAERVVVEMRRGQSLHCAFDAHDGAVWRLSGGRRVANRAAELAIGSPHVVAVDLPLFPGLVGQTYRHIG